MYNYRYSDRLETSKRRPHKTNTIITVGETETKCHAYLASVSQLCPCSPEACNLSPRPNVAYISSPAKCNRNVV